MILIALIIHHLSITLLVTKLVCQQFPLPLFEAMSVQSHPVSQHTRNLFPFAANCSSTELLCTGPLIHFRFPMFALRLSQDVIQFVIICRHMVTFAHTSCGVKPRLSFFPRLLRFTLKSFWTLFGDALAKDVPVLCGVSLGHHPVTIPRTSIWRKSVSNNKTSHNRSKLRTMRHPHRRSNHRRCAFS